MPCRDPCRRFSTPSPWWCVAERCCHLCRLSSRILRWSSDPGFFSRCNYPGSRTYRCPLARYKLWTNRAWSHFSRTTDRTDRRAVSAPSAQRLWPIWAADPRNPRGVGRSTPRRTVLFEGCPWSRPSLAWGNELHTWTGWWLKASARLALRPNPPRSRLTIPAIFLHVILAFFFSWEDGNETWFLNRGEGNDSNLKIYGIYGIMESFLKNRNFRNLLFFLERKREILWEIKKFDLRNITNFSSNLDICDILIIRIIIFLDCNRN